MTPADKTPGGSSSAEASFLHLAEAYRKEGLFEDAVRICRGGLVRFPSSWSGRILLAKLLMDQGSAAEASEEISRVRSEAGGRPEILAALEEALGAVSTPDGETGEPVEPGVLILDSSDGSAQPRDADSEASARRDPLATPTLAKLFASQGDTERAEAILRQLGQIDESTGLPAVSPEGRVRQRYLDRLLAFRDAVRREQRPRRS